MIRPVAADRSYDAPRMLTTIVLGAGKLGRMLGHFLSATGEHAACHGDIDESAASRDASELSGAVSSP